MSKKLTFYSLSIKQFTDLFQVNDQVAADIKHWQDCRLRGHMWRTMREERGLDGKGQGGLGNNLKICFNYIKISYLQEYWSH